MAAATGVNHAEWTAKLKKLRKKIRSEEDSSDWDQYGFAYLDLSSAIPECVNTLRYVNVDDYTPDSFMKAFDIPRIPVVIDGVARNWPAMTKWTRARLLESYGDKVFDVGSHNHTYITLREYFHYCDHNDDDTPLYAFEPKFADKYPELLDDFAVPRLFPSDLLAYAGEDDRPYYRWLLIGAQRTGTGIHIDPHATNAWNTLLVGEKRWALFPPDIPAGDVEPSDGTPDTAICWFLRVLPELKPTVRARMLDVVQRPGETMFVPRGWWHVVVNLSFTVSVTANFVNEINFEDSFAILAKKKPKIAAAWYDGLPADLRAKVVRPVVPESSSSSSSSSSSAAEGSASASSGASGSDGGGRMM
eukprot:c39159_g1_i1.p2 GENE.c39159_g1_i1~~c39159_g1_i1.p2  ORF type:complete len:360 (+),score=68.52 c39159_g1_i1:107-1186(+)